MKDFSRTVCIFLGVSAAMLLASCGGGGGGSGGSGGSTSASSAPVAWSVSIPSTPLSAQQQAALDSGQALLSAGDYNGAIALLTTVRSAVPGINTDVEAGLGLSYAARSNLSLAGYRSAAVAQTITNGSATVSISASDAALFTLTTYVPGFANDLAILDGNVALEMLVPFNTAVSSLPEARQAEIGMIATLQFLRVITNVMGGNSRFVTDATINSRVQAGYDANARAALNLSAKLLTATNAALSKQITDGLIVSLPSGLSSVLADGDITSAELSSLLKTYKR